MNEVNIYFYLRNGSVNKDGTLTIMVRVKVGKGGASQAYSTKRTVLREEWDQTNQIALISKNIPKENKIHNKETNKILEELKAELKQTYQALKKTGAPITPKRVKDRVNGEDRKSFMLINYCTQYCDLRKIEVPHKLTKKTYSRYVCTTTRLKEFLEFKYKESIDIPLQMITPEFVEEFDSYIRTKYDLLHNTVVAYMKRFRTMFEYAKWYYDSEFQLNFPDPFIRYSFKLEKTNPVFLTKEELILVCQKKLRTNRVARIRDFFIFSCFTGLAYCDVQTLTQEHIKTHSDGSLWIIKKREKTDVEFRVRLLEIPLTILQKYESLRVDERLLPIPSNQKTNEYIGELMEVCGIDKHVTCHSARHTFATTVCSGNGIPIETISKMLGHTDIKTTQIYLRVLESKLSDDMEDWSQKVDQQNYSLNQHEIKPKKDQIQRQNLISSGLPETENNKYLYNYGVSSNTI